VFVILSGGGFSQGDELAYVFIALIFLMVVFLAKLKALLHRIQFLIKTARELKSL